MNENINPLDFFSDWELDLAPDLPMLGQICDEENNMKNNPPKYLTQKEIELLSNTSHCPSEVKRKINIPVNFSTFEEQFDKLVKKDELCQKSTT